MKCTEGTFFGKSICNCEGFHSSLFYQKTLFSKYARPYELVRFGKHKYILHGQGYSYFLPVIELY